ncbi:MAG: asparaginase [Anaerolineales bacterium]|nr:asparaginase [Anaerolineales bacterium]
MSNQPNFNNCSGKHTAMLAFAKMRGLPLRSLSCLRPPHSESFYPGKHSLKCAGSKWIRFNSVLTAARLRDRFAVPLINAALGMARIRPA